MGSGWDLRLVWYMLVGVLFAGYVILDGFDLGVGILHLGTRKERDRRVLLNTIGPVWDGNEVWLVTGGGALFAAFPDVYATVFSGFYHLFILLLFGLIIRAVAIECRSRRPMAWWRAFWDAAFALSSAASSFLIGVIFGNLVWGVPLTSGGEYAGNTAALFGPYALLMGVLALLLFATHGAIYAVLKTEGELRDKLRRWGTFSAYLVICGYAVLTLYTVIGAPHMSDIMRQTQWLLIVPIAAAVVIVRIPFELKRGRDAAAFVFSSLSFALLFLLFGIGMFPNLVYSNPHPEYSLTLANASSSAKTLFVMLVIALLGMPLVVAYTTGIYWIFRDKVRIDDSSY